jgi:hypothetical protein
MADALVREMNAALTLRNNRQQVRALNIRTARRQLNLTDISSD